MLKRFLSKIFRIKSDKITSKKISSDYRKITAVHIAFENGIDYIADPKSRKLDNRGNYIHSFYSYEGKYILLYPANTEIPTVPIEWYFYFNGELKLIMDNQSSFKCITNLDEIILQMLKLYTKYIDKDVFIEAESFAIMLEDEISPNYHGRAKLVLTKNSIRNDTIGPNHIMEAKKYFINNFLDHYLGWNFGTVITNNPKLEKELIKFNKLVIKKGLREYAGSCGSKLFESEDVTSYLFETL